MTNHTTPISLDALRTAWENAEVPTEATPIRGGDTVIYRTGPNGRETLRDFSGFAIESADSILSGQTHGVERVLSRAPQREPWVELAGVLHDEAPRGVVDVDHLAERLYAAGVRVTGGDDQ